MFTDSAKFANLLAQNPLPSMSTAETQRRLKVVLLQASAAKASLSADCTSMLGVDDLILATPFLQSLFHVGDTLLPTKERQSVKKAEAMILLRDAGLCELLLGLLQRMPWDRMRLEQEVRTHGLALLPTLLRGLCDYLGAAPSVRSSQQAAACAEMSSRCVWPKRACAQLAALRTCPV